MKLHSGFLASMVLSMLGLLALTSCGDIIQELKLNPDGSGTLETSFDVGDLMSMAKGFQGMGTDSTGATDDTMPAPIVPDTTKPKDPMQLLIEKVTDPAYPRDFDTTMSFLSIMPDSVKAKDTHKDLAERLSMRLVSPANSANLTIGILAKFNSPKQLKEIMEYMNKLDEKPELMPNAGPVALQTKSFLLFNMDTKAGLITVDSIKYGDLASGFGMGQDSTGSEDQSMMQMMFGNSKIKSIIHVPGEVLSCSNPNAIITKDNKVILENDVLDVVHKGSIPAFTIHFQPKK